jgi:formylmethanofuran dehydrogenase subunit C
VRLTRLVDDAYRGLNRGRRLKSQEGDPIFSLDDLAERVGCRPSRVEVEELLPPDPGTLERLLMSDPGKGYQIIWGHLSSIAAERSPEPLRLPARDYAGLGLSRGGIILEGEGKSVDHVGERMSGGRIYLHQGAGDYLGQEMTGGGIITAGVGSYAFRRMSGGWGVIRGEGGNFLALGSSGGRVVCQGGCGERAGWLMSGGSLRIHGDAGDYLGLLMKGGRITIFGRAGRRAGWRMKGGTIRGREFGPEAADGVLGLD